MATVTEIGSLAVAGFGAAATFVAARRALGDFTTFGSPTVMAACVAGLAFLGILPVAHVLLIPFAALAVAVMALPFIRFLASQGLFGGRESDNQAAVPRFLRRLHLPSTPESDPQPQLRADTQTPAPAPARPRSTSSQTKPRTIPLAIKPRSARSPKSKSSPPRS